MEVILYYNREGAKNWIMAEKGSSIVDSLISMGIARKSILVLDVTGQVTKETLDSFRY